MARRARNESGARSACENAQALEQVCDSFTSEAEVSVLPLRHDAHEPLGLETVEMHTRGGRTDLSDERELGRGSCVAAHQAIQHPGTGRLSDRRGDSCDRPIVMDIYSLIVDEV